MSNGTPDTTLDEVQVTAQAPTPPTVAPLSVPYARRRISLTFQLSTGRGGTTTLTVSGQRVIVHIDQVVWPQMGSHAWMKIYGLTLDHMNLLSNAGLLYLVGKSQVLIQAGDDVLGLATVFNGIIVEAYPSLDTAQDGHFYVYASLPSIYQVKPVAPTSYPSASGVPAATAISDMAKAAGFNFRNDGVTAVLATPYFWGTSWQQIYSAVRAADCFAYLDDASGTLVIWPKTGGAEPPSANIVISPQTGMIGYPKFQQSKIIVRTLFNPQISMRPSLTVTVRSQLKAADQARFKITDCAYDLASELPDGPWEVTVAGQPPLPPASGAPVP